MKPGTLVSYDGAKLHPALLHGDKGLVTSRQLTEFRGHKRITYKVQWLRGGFAATHFYEDLIEVGHAEEG